jgi:FKBP-type peptidyl-prolyl cis-trans isomerase
VTKRWFLPVLLGLSLIAAVALVGCGAETTRQSPASAASGTGSAEQPAAPQSTQEAPPAGAPATASVTKLVIKDTVVGKGAAAKSGDSVTVNYTGYLTDGTKFDSSVGKAPFTFPLGAGQVIPGWDQGVAGMKVGGKRKLTIPPDLGYGAAGAGGVIPPNATLVFDVEMLKIN